jgi:hypothetical protein
VPQAPVFAAVLDSSSCAWTVTEPCGCVQGQGSSIKEKLQTAIGFGPKDSIVTEQVSVQIV